ncbi:MAG: transposase [Sphingobacteriales bacterium]
MKGYDYSRAGLYFITVCVRDGELLFGKIENDEMLLNGAGKMIQTEWEKLPQRFGNIALHEFVVMPNHFHGILEIGHGGATDAGRQNDTGETLVGAALVAAPDEQVDVKDMDDRKNTDPPERADTGDRADMRERAAEDRAATRAAPTVVENDNGDPNDIDEPTRKTLGDMMGAFKSITTVEYIAGVKNLGWAAFRGKLWQRDYYEHIIRNERAYENISDYIISNPARWKDDRFYGM